MNPQSVEYLIGRVEDGEKRIRELEAELASSKGQNFDRAKTLTTLRDEAYENAKAHGFHDVGRTVGDAMMLLCTEVAEAFEAYREGAVVNETKYEGSPTFKGTDGKLYKPVGVPSEIADVLVRCFDFCGEHDIDIERVVLEKMAYNRSRPFKHGGKAL